LNQPIVRRFEGEYGASGAAARDLFERLTDRRTLDELTGDTEVRSSQHVTKAALRPEVRDARRLLDGAGRAANRREDRVQGLGRKITAGGGVERCQCVAIGRVEGGLALGAGPDVFRGARAGLEAFQNLAIQPRYLRSELRRAASRIHAQLLAAPVLEEPPEVEPLDEEPLDEEPLDEEPLDEEPLDEEPLDAAGVAVLLAGLVVAGLLSVAAVLAVVLSALFFAPPLLL